MNEAYRRGDAYDVEDDPGDDDDDDEASRRASRRRGNRPTARRSPLCRAPPPPTMAWLPRTWNEELQEALKRIARDQGRMPSDAICILMTVVLQALPGWTEQHVVDVVRRQPPTAPSRLQLLLDAFEAPFAICWLPRGFGPRGAEAYLERISKDMHRAFLGKGRRRIAADAWRGVYVPVTSLADVIQHTPDEVELVAKTSYSERRRSPRFRILAATAGDPLVTSVRLEQRQLRSPEAATSQAFESGGGGEIRDADACCVCLTRRATHATDPCGHYCLCPTCAISWADGGSCPICRGDVQRVLRIFRSAAECGLRRETPGGA